MTTHTECTRIETTTALPNSPTHQVQQTDPLCHTGAVSSLDTAAHRLSSCCSHWVKKPLDKAEVPCQTGVTLPHCLQPTHNAVTISEVVAPADRSLLLPEQRCPAPVAGTGGEVLPWWHLDVQLRRSRPSKVCARQLLVRHENYLTWHGAAEASHYQLEARNALAKGSVWRVSM